ncbi:MAG: class I SAM-dependent methyltransferase [Planctomycetota bacterium]
MRERKLQGAAESGFPGYGRKKPETCQMPFLRACLYTPRPDTGEIQNTYSPEYFKKFYLKKDRLKSGFFRRMLKRIETLKNKGKILDVGCGTGLFLQLANRHGWETAGVEIASFAAEFCRNELRLNVRTGTLAGQNFPGNSFDVVTMWDVLEHETVPRQTLAEIRRILKPDGILMLKVPDMDSPINQTLLFYSRLKKINLVHAPNHLFHFTRSTLKRMLMVCGFSPRRFWPVDDPVEWEFASVVKSFLFRWLIIISRVLNRRDSMVLVASK